MTDINLDEIKDGDVFRWSWKDNRGCHAKSRIFFAQGGYLVDTYYENPLKPTTYGDGYKRQICPEILEEFNLLHLGNVNDYQPLDPADAIYYRTEDVMNLSHANAPGLLMLRTGAPRDPATMLTTMQRMFRMAQTDLLRMRYEVDHLADQITHLQMGGDPTEVSVSDAVRRNER